jgi:hypothetical protein
LFFWQVTAGSFGDELSGDGIGLTTRLLWLAVPADKDEIAAITALFLASIGDEIALVPPKLAVTFMCQKCIAIDVRIERYRWLMTQVSDERTRNAIAVQISTLKNRKATIHPDNRPGQG